MPTATLTAPQARALLSTPPPPLPQFSRWLREFLAEQGHTQEVAGRIIGVKATRVGQVLRGDSPGVKFLEGLIRGFALEDRRGELERMAGLGQPSDPGDTSAISPEIIRQIVRETIEEERRQATGRTSDDADHDPDAPQRVQAAIRDGDRLLAEAGVDDFPAALRNYSGGASRRAADDWIADYQQILEWAIRQKKRSG